MYIIIFYSESQPRLVVISSDLAMLSYSPLCYNIIHFVTYILVKIRYTIFVRGEEIFYLIFDIALDSIFEEVDKLQWMEP